MNKKKECKYLNKMYKKMQQQYKAFVCTQNPESLHGFRVQVKKIRSFLTLLEADTKNDQLLQTFKPVRKLFKQTGIIRDAYIHQKQAENNHLDAPHFYKEQHALQQEKTDQLLQHQKQLLHKMKRTKHRLLRRMKAVPKNEMEQFFTIQISHTKQLLNSHNFSEQLHNGRKMLKHLLYNRNIIPNAIAKEMNLDFKKIDAMQQSIGDWHDNKLALDFFSKQQPAIDLEALKQKQEGLKKNISAKAAGFAQMRAQ
jgi:CHAD domain-containing protein